MRFGNTEIARDSASRISYSTTYNRTLTAGDGTKTVYAEFKDANGTTGIVSDDILLSGTAPAIDFTGNTPSDGYITTNRAISGTIEHFSSNIKSFSRTWNNNTYLFDLTGRHDDFGTGEYSITDYADEPLVIAYNLDNISSLWESTTVIKDFSNNNISGSITDATRTGNGEFNWAFHITGHQYLSFSNPSSLNTFTVEGRAKITSGENGVQLINNNNNNSSTNGYGSFALNVTTSYLYVIWDKYNGSSYAGAKIAFNFDDYKRHAITTSINSLDHTILVYIDGKSYPLEEIGWTSYSLDKTRIQALPTATIYFGSKGNVSASVGYGDVDNIRIYDKNYDKNRIIYHQKGIIQKTSDTDTIFKLSNLPSWIHKYQACSINTGNNIGCTEIRTLNIIDTETLIHKTSDQTYYHGGDTIDYTINFSNTWNQNISNAVIQDTLSSGLTYLSYTITGINSYTFGTGIDNSGNTILTRSWFNLNTWDYGLINIQARIDQSFPILSTTHYDLDTGFITPEFWESNPTSGEIIEKLYAENSPYTQLWENYNSWTCSITTGDIVIYNPGDSFNTLGPNKIYILNSGEYHVPPNPTLNQCTALLGKGNVEISTTSNATDTLLINDAVNYSIVDNIKLDGEKGHVGTKNIYGINIYREASNNTINNVESYNSNYGIIIYIYEEDTQVKTRYTKNNLINNSLAYNNTAGISIDITMYDDEIAYNENNVINNCQVFNNDRGIYLISRWGPINAGAKTYVQYNTISNSQIYNNKNWIYLLAYGKNWGWSPNNTHTISNNSFYNSDIYNNTLGIYMERNSDLWSISNNNFADIKIYNNTSIYGSSGTIGSNYYYNPLHLFDNDDILKSTELISWGTGYYTSLGRTWGSIETGTETMSCDYANLPRNRSWTDLYDNNGFSCNTRGENTSRITPLQGIQYGYYLTRQTKPIKYNGTSLEYFGTWYIDYFEILANARIKPLGRIENILDFSGDNLTGRYILNTEYKATSDLRVQKTVTGNYHSWGIIVYTINYGNSGYDDDTITIIDTLSPSWLSWSNYNNWTRTYSGNNSFFTGFSIGKVSSGTLVFTAIVLTGTTWATGINTISITGNNYDIDTSNNQDEISFNLDEPDNTAPNIENISPSSGTILNVNYTTLVWSGSDANGISGYLYQVYRRDDTLRTNILSWTTTNTWITITGLQDKSYKRQVKAQDNNNNRSNYTSGWIFSVEGTSCPTSFTRNNDNFITQTGFRDNNPNSCDIMLALYGDNTGDNTAYTEHWDNRNRNCNRSSWLNVEYINPGNGSIPNVLSWNTIYVLNSGDYLLPYSTGTNMSGCTTIIGSGDVNVYSTGQIINKGLVNNTYDFWIVDNLKINGSGDGLGSTHGKNSYGILLQNTQNTTINNVNISDHGSYGLYIYQSPYTNIFNISSYKNYYGIYCRNSDYNYIESSYFFDNSIYGVEAYYSDNSILSWWWIYNNASYGLYLAYANNAKAINTKIHDNGSYWAYITASTSWKIYNSNIYNNTDGIYFYQSATGQVKNSKIYGNNNGIHSYSAQNLLISWTEIYNNTNNWIYLYLSSYGEINNVQSFKNSTHWIYINWGSYNTINNSKVYNNNSNGINITNDNHTSLNNIQSFNNTNQGIYFNNADNSVLNQANIYNNNNDGIKTQNSTNVILNNNNIYNNDGYGMLFDTNSTNTKYYGKLKLFDNIRNSLSWTDGNDIILDAGLNNDTLIIPLWRSDGNLSTSWCMTCDWYSNPQNNSWEFMMNTWVYQDCLWRGTINWLWTTGTAYLYWENINKQTTGTTYSWNDLTFSDLPINTSKYIAQINSLWTSTWNQACESCDFWTIWWENNNLITQSGFRNNNPNSCDIKIALYGTGETDTTAYNKNRNDFYNNCSYKHLKVIYLTPTIWNSWVDLPWYTIYVLSGGSYRIPYINGLNTQKCTAILGSGKAYLYSTGQITNKGLINDSYNFWIIDNININGSGDGIGGTHGENSYGILLQNAQNTTINNVNTTDNQNYGLYNNNSDYSQIYNTKAYNNLSYGLYLSNSDEFYINTFKSYNNNNYQIYISSSLTGTIENAETYSDWRGIYLYNADNQTLSWISSHDNTNGIYINGSDNLKIYNSTGYNNTSNGIYSIASSNQTIENVSTYNNNYGLYLRNANDSTFSGLKNYNNTYGVYFYQTNRSQINNIQWYNNDYWIKFDYSNDNTIHNGQEYNNTYDGIFINNGSQNSINNSQIYNNGTYGIRINKANSSIINKSNIYNNATNGIIFQDSTTWLLNNIQIYNNGDYGILFDALSTWAKYYWKLKLFDNINGNLSGTNAYDIHLTGGSNSDSGIVNLWRSTGVLSTTGTMSCELYTNPKNNLWAFLMNTCTYIYCEWTGKIIWTGTSDTTYLYGSDIAKQETWVYYSWLDIIFSNLSFDTGDFIAETASLGEYDNTYACVLPTIQHISPLSWAIISTTSVDLLRSGYSSAGISGYYYRIYRRDSSLWTEILSGSTTNTWLTITWLQDATYKRQIKAEDNNWAQSERHTGWTFEANKYTDLQITKTANQTGYYIYDYIIYSINFTNSGTITATWIEITDTLITGIDYISSSYTGPSGYSFASGLNNTWEMWLERSGFDLTAWETWQIIITGQIIKSFSWSNIDNTIRINTTSWFSTTNYNPSTDLYISKSVTGDYSSGGVVSYTIDYGNSGYDNATNIQITETPNQRLSWIDYSSTWTNNGDGSFSTNIWDLTIGETRSLVFTATIISWAEGWILLNNTVEITWYYFDINTWNNSYTTGFKTVDTTNPYIYFTGDTPTSWTISTNTTFTGQVEIIEPHLSGLFWNWDGTEYILHLDDHRNIFNTGFYSWTNYQETGIILAMNFDNNSWFNENSGTIADLAGWNNTGTITPTSSYRTGDEGKYNGSFYFSGCNLIDLDDDLSLYSEIITLSSRIKGTGRVLRNGWWYDEQYSMIINSISGKLWIEYVNTGGSFVTKSSSEWISDLSKRNHVVITRDANYLIKFYINGKFISSEQATQPATWGSVRIWCGGNPSQPFQWYIDDLRIYNRVLSSWEIRQLYSTTITKPADKKRSFTVTKENLTDGTYTYQACAEDLAWNTWCTETRNYTIQTPKTITIKTANPYTTTGDFWLFKKLDISSRKQIFNSSKVEGDKAVSIYYGSQHSSGDVNITGQYFPNSGDEYLAVFKLNGSLSVGYTGLWNNNITGFDFSENGQNNIYPLLTYQWNNYLYIGDMDTNGSWAYDLIYGPDLDLLNTHLSKNTFTPFNPIFDFDANSVVTALEQAMILYNIDIGWYIQDYLPSGLTIDNFKSF